MKHPDEKQLTAMAMGLGHDNFHAHIEACPACRGEVEAIRATLALAAALPAPEADPGLSLRILRRLQTEAAAKTAPSRPRLRWAFALTAAVAVTLAVWVLRPAPAAPPAPVAAVAGAPPSPLLAAAVSDHLDRTQVLLLELAHAQPAGAAGDVDLAPERRWARELLAANRLYQQDARASGQPTMAHLLSTLEPVLLEIAHAPDPVSPDAWRQMQFRIAASGILFQLRVVDQTLQLQMDNQEQNGSL